MQNSYPLKTEKYNTLSRIEGVDKGNLHRGGGGGVLERRLGALLSADLVTILSSFESQSWGLVRFIEIAFEFEFGEQHDHKIPTNWQPCRGGPSTDQIGHPWHSPSMDQVHDLRS
jgi:hypothetical protein